MYTRAHEHPDHLAQWVGAEKKKKEKNGEADAERARGTVLTLLSIEIAPMARRAVHRLSCLLTLLIAPLTVIYLTVMRKKLSAVIAHALHDAGVLVATHVPDTVPARSSRRTASSVTKNSRSRSMRKWRTRSRTVLAAKRRCADWTRLQTPAIPHIPWSLPERWKPVAESYAPLFSAFQSLRGAIVTGDTGVSSLFAVPPYSCVDITTYVGGSIPLAIGAFMAGFDDV